MRGLILVPYPSRRVEISIDEPQFRWMREHGTLHIPDVRAQNEFPMLGSVGGLRTFLAVPLRQQGELIGTLTARRTEVRPFTPAQIKLLETFADQAVIAIENVRLFKNSRSRWSSKLRRVKSWVSSPARRRIFSRCWMWSRRMRRDFATQTMLSSFASNGDVLDRVAHLWTNSRASSAENLPVSRGSVDWSSRCRPAKRSMFTISRQRLKRSFRKR